MKRDKTNCPECGAGIHIKTRPHRSQNVRCPGCGIGLEVIGLDPLEVDLTIQGNLTGAKKKAGKVIEVPCSECEHPLKLSSHSRLGQQVICPGCRAMLQVVNSGPLELELAMGIPLPPKYRNW